MICYWLKIEERAPHEAKALATTTAKVQVVVTQLLAPQSLPSGSDQLSIPRSLSSDGLKLALVCEVVESILVHIHGIASAMWKRGGLNGCIQAVRSSQSASSFTRKPSSILGSKAINFLL
ncbi:uncharacterized protein PGTG_11956 [Puccinia graminis f. sp. tritici CRL 75-36-700-3]|uniref:Uncharacterized protein n=1 Tax=Puccinia graminis f. sp. tritici (strain CRL 75-36-700-3 / race SCCL) TaxID=418459 RepID=E3KMS5_PUCGT|nr:uncharacterized protein PGTG_11956 [Puccinia graminis f. sp. tritici CRL 75-36-700-3]EFP85600.1 hypothetical protein PGTG_11956 [Puccinia graminis f. sp. tritici CRL 75-36-700-3]